jgi:hypothetical protein
MAIEITTQSAPTSCPQNWAPKARRQGEAADWTPQPPRPGTGAEPETIYPSLSTPPVQWPRVFPSL